VQLIFRAAAHSKIWLENRFVLRHKSSGHQGRCQLQLMEVGYFIFPLTLLFPSLSSLLYTHSGWLIVHYSFPSRSINLSHESDIEFLSALGIVLSWSCERASPASESQRTVVRATRMPSNDEYYSSLEVAHPSIPSSPAPSCQEKQVTPNENLEASHNQKYIAYSTEGLELVAIGYNEDGGLLKSAQDAEKPKRKRLWWIVGGAILLVVIVVAVVGGVLASKKSNPSGDGTDSSSTVTPVSGLSSTGTTSSSSATGTTKTTSATATSSIRHSIAVAGYSPSNMLFLRRFYFLDSMSQIQKAAQQWGDPKTWVAEGLGIYAKPGTPLAAGISRPGFDEVRLNCRMTEFKS
jgi:hypothetical protein